MLPSVMANGTGGGLENRVFIASTRGDDPTWHETVKDVIISIGMVPVSMAQLNAGARTVGQELEHQVESCGWFVGILGHRYGSIPMGEQRSLIEIAYDVAAARGIPRLIFQLDESVNVNPRRDFDEGPDRWKKQALLDAFQERISTELTPGRFKVENLGARVMKALLEERSRQSHDAQKAPPKSERARPAPDSRPIVLVILANDRISGMRRLRNLAAERRGITERLGPSIETVVIHDALLDEVWDELDRPEAHGRTRVFHFAGHGSGDWLAFEDEEGTPATAHADGLASYLARQDGLVLVFLNACSTSKQVARLRASGVPAVIATSAAIDDEVAAQLATRFYAELSHNPLERAFRNAVDFMKAKYGNEPRGLIRRELEFDDGEFGDGWPWLLDCDEAVKGWRLVGEPPPSSDGAPSTDDSASGGRRDHDERTTVDARPADWEREALAELASVLYDPEMARLVALRAGVPPAMMPAFRSSIVFWSLVVEGAQSGMLSGGLQPIVDEAARMFPANRVFAKYRTRDD